jgi:hypothetical protein
MLSCLSYVFKGPGHVCDGTDFWMDAAHHNMLDFASSVACLGSACLHTMLNCDLVDQHWLGSQPTCCALPSILSKQELQKPASLEGKQHTFLLPQCTRTHLCAMRCAVAQLRCAASTSGSKQSTISCLLICGEQRRSW